jgi:hypothetical protein
MARINGIQATAIAGLGQIGVGGGSPAPTPVTYPTGGLIANSGFFNNNDGTVLSINGQTGSQPPWWDRPNYGTGVTSASVWTKIAGHNNSTMYLLSSSGELFSAGLTYTYTGRTSVGFVAGRIDKVINVTPTSSWTDITLGTGFVLGINDGYIYGTGAPNNGEFGSGSISQTQFGTWLKLSPNQGWIRVEAGSNHSAFMSGSGGSGSVWIAGSNGSGRTGMNTTGGSTINRAEPFGKTGSIWTDMSCGPTNTFLISESKIWGTGANTQYQLGDNTTTQRTSFGNAVATGSTYTSVYAMGAYTKAISSESFHHHAGNQAYSRGDGSTANVPTWTRINTSSEFATGWSKFYGPNNFNNPDGLYGICNNRPFFLKFNVGNSYTAWCPKTTVPYQSASYQRPDNPVGTWVPFISGGNNMNITCSAMGWTSYNSSNSPYLPAVWMYLTPQ